MERGAPCYYATSEERHAIEYTLWVEMKVALSSGGTLLLGLWWTLATKLSSQVDAFGIVVRVPPQRGIQHSLSPSSSSTPVPSRTQLGAASGNIMFGGEPSERGKSLNHRQVIRDIPFQRVTGEMVTMDELLSDNSRSPVSIVVFLRSLG